MKARMSMLISAMLMVGALAGCGGDAGDSPAGGGGTTTVGLSCGLMPASTVNTALGTTVGDPEEQLVGHGAVCNYKPVEGARGSVIVRIQTDTTRALFDQGRATSDSNGIPTADLPGFEDAAYTSTGGTASVTVNTVVALKGTVQILVSSPAALEAEKDLEQQIFAVLT